MRVFHFHPPLTIVATALFLAAGCGGAASEAKAPPPASGTVAPSAGAPKNEQMIESSSIGRAQTDFEDASHAVELAGNDCAQLCKALSSMSRAAERLCALAKDAGDDGLRRCTDARAKLEAARARVRETCPACEPG